VVPLFHFHFLRFYQLLLCLELNFIYIDSVILTVISYQYLTNLKGWKFMKKLLKEKAMEHCAFYKVILFDQNPIEFKNTNLILLFQRFLLRFENESPNMGGSKFIAFSSTMTRKIRNLNKSLLAPTRGVKLLSQISQVFFKISKE